MIKQRNITQEELRYVYETAQRRMNAHPDVTKKYKKMIEDFSFYTDKNESIKAADNMRQSGCFGCQVWAKVGKSEEYYYIEDHYIVSDDNFIKMSAEYIGMEQVY